MARKMKDSGIEWIGEIPEGWEVVPVRSCFDEVRTKNTDGQEQNALQFKSGNIISKANFNTNIDDYVADTITNYTVVLPDTIMINGLNLNYDFKSLRVALVKEKGVITSAYLAIFPDREKIFPQYATYLFKGYETKMAFHNMGAGIRKTLGYKEFKNQPLLLPSKEEQNKISAYLDSKCSHIDIMLSKICSSIEKYKKLKQAIITQAVTKGVRGKREMKDSGVEWISEIPANWTVKRGKQLFSETNERSETGSEELLTVSHITGVTPRSQKNVNMFKSESLVGYKICHNGDLAANTMWMWQGAIGVSKFHGVISPSYNTYRQKTNDYYFDYLDFLLRIRPLIDAYTIHSTGITLSRLRLYPDSFLSLYFIVPPITEQKEIADFLDTKCTEIDKLIAKKEQLVKELESYKKSLIYEVVTGKREV